MEPIDILNADPLDILFENRNKSYGAYPLRKFYTRRLYISMGFTLSVVILSSFIFLNFQHPAVYSRVIDMPDNYIGTVILTPKDNLVITPPKPMAPRPLVSTQQVTPTLIVPDPQAIRPIATVENINDANIGVKTLAGGPDNGEVQNNGNSTGTEIKAGAPVEIKSEVFDKAEVMPEFPGGMEALKKYLARNLHMPESNLEPGSTVHVIAHFVVGEDGRVRNIEIVKEADAVFNTEVKRVISKMPDWKPGFQNHRNVAVYFNLPVNFVSAE